MPGLDLLVTAADKVLDWGGENSPHIFPMATSCCGIEFMAGFTARMDLDRFGAVVRASPRHADVMIIAGTITVKMAPRVKKLWDQMPEPKWAIAMGSCAISGDFYRDIYSVVPGVDTFMPVDVYVPGCPPNPEWLVDGIRRLQEKIRLKRQGKWVEPEKRPETAKSIIPDVKRLGDADRDPAITAAQMESVMGMDLGGAMTRRLPILPPGAVAIERKEQP
ncbi:MAG: NADH-quinone oxidoreductase subunit NuoB [Deltaproteobacteria bacterium]|nr:NADH-quinone oxidoreductase subunit NuoB [Deltaproteobacteria bacterium]